MTNNTKYKRLTFEQKLGIKKLVKARVSYSDIAREYSVTPNAIRHFAVTDLGAKPKTYRIYIKDYPIDTELNIVKDIEKGIKYRILSKKYKLSSSTIYRIGVKYGYRRKEKIKSKNTADTSLNDTLVLNKLGEISGILQLIHTELVRIRQPNIEVKEGER